MQAQDSENVHIIDYSTLQIDYSHRLGFGAYSEVFPGKLGSFAIAIKKLKTSETELRKEASIHYSLKHPNIVSLYGISLGPEQYLMIMPQLSMSLTDLLLGSTPLSRWQVYNLLEGIVAGIRYLHAHQLIHRDLKTSNILIDVTQGFHPLIADFGLSQWINDRKNPPVQVFEAKPQVTGAPAWMAPELFRLLPCTFLSDIYSIGVILWAMLHRKMPFAEVDRQDIIRMVRRGEREEIKPELAREAAKLIRHCWRQNPQKRLPLNVIAKKIGFFKLQEESHVAESNMLAMDLN